MSKKSKEKPPSAQEPSGFTRSRPYVPGYGIPKHTRGLLPWSFVDQRMSKAMNYWVCTLGANGTPHARPVWGVWVDNAICFGGHGVRWECNLAANPEVTVNLESSEEVVILEGAAQRVTNPDDPIVPLVKKASDAKYGMSGPPPFWSLRPRAVFAWTLKARFQDATRWRLR